MPAHVESKGNYLERYVHLAVECCSSSGELTNVITNAVRRIDFRAKRQQFRGDKTRVLVEYLHTFVIASKSTCFFR